MTPWPVEVVRLAKRSLRTGAYVTNLLCRRVHSDESGACPAVDADAGSPTPDPRLQGPATPGSARPGVPPRDTPVSKPGSGRIQGRIVAADTNAPLRRAQVMLISGQIGVRRATTTDAEGRYQFTELAEGRYIVTASKGGYVTLQYGQRRAFEPGRQVALADAQDVGRIDVALPRGSVIAGRVTDEFGEPIAGARIEVQRYQYTPSGQRRLMFAGGSGLVMTDDLGAFRAYGLMPGEYVVSSSVRAPGFQIGANPNDATEGYAPTYYPGTPNPAEAELVRVGLAQDTSIHLTLQAARLARVSGVVTDASGKALGGVQVIARSQSDSGFTMATNGSTGADGAFSLANVPPGEHFIDVFAQSRGSDGVPEAASVPLTVSGGDITGLRITTAPAAVVSGVVVFEGASPRGGVLGGLRVIAQSATEQVGPFLGPGTRGGVGEDGKFELQAIGRVFFRPVNLGPWTLKEVVLEGDDITDTPLELTGVARVQGLRIVLTDRVTDLSGGVTNDRGQPLNEFVVVVQPADDVPLSTLRRFLRTARPDQDGKFGLRGIPPAEYIATAVETLEQGGEWDPEYRSRLRDAGRRFTVKEGESIQLDLPLSGL